MTEIQSPAATADSNSLADAGVRSDLFGHPPGLTVLFLTDMWGYFGYYGMRAMLIYYLTQTLSYSQAEASFVFGTYVSAAFLMSLLGGFLADRYLGKRRSVFFGAVMMAVGNFMLVSPSLLYPGLAVLAIGGGFFGSCLPSQITGLYRRNDVRIPSAYNFYYVGVNFGGFLGGIICGALGEHYGWTFGFVIAGCLMLPGLFIYGVGQRYLPSETKFALLDKPQIARRAKFEPAKLRFLIGVLIAVIIFRITYEQAFNSVVLWIGQDVDRRVGAFQIPMTWFQSIDPLIVMLAGPVMGGLWTRRSSAGHIESPCSRMAIGTTVVALAYVILALAIWLLGGVRASWALVVVFMVILTLGELFVFPIALSLFGRLAPEGASGTAFGMWFVATSAGNFLAGLFAMLWSVIHHDLFFLLSAGFAVVGTLLLLRLRPQGLALTADAARSAD